ncbi:MAG: elongation factor Ts [Bacteroidales bacterium]|jgi:elongation factor Ts|nr:elongation factor Ts [Bacteroidales bacterium]
MANITAADVYKLRDMTGVGVMDCKKALVEAEGDFDAAIDILRKKGQKLASKRAEREANEGIVIAKISDDKSFGAVMMLNCETDFVGKNEDFVANANKFIDVAMEAKAKSMDEFTALQIDGRTIADHVIDLVGKIGEKITLSRYEIVEAENVVFYNHHSNRISALVGFNKGSEAIDIAGKDVAMQIAAMAPVAIDKDDVSEEIIAKEIEVGKEQARQEGKPEDMLEKIAQGKLGKFFKESTLLNQAFIKDNKSTVAEYLKSVDADLKVTKFYRIALGA